MHSRKVSGSEPAPALSGQISRVSIADLLSTLEGRGRDAVVRFATPAGPASVWFTNGRLVDAEMGVLSGEPALYRVLGLNQGTFEVASEHSERPRVIQDPVSVLVARRSKRAARWEDLVFGGPALDAVPTRGSTPPPEPSEKEDQKLLRLVDGRRTLLEILDESRLDPVQALEVLGRLQQDGHFSIDRLSTSRPPPPRPEPSVLREVRKSAPTRLQPDRVPPRTSTLVGLSSPSPLPPSDESPPLKSVSDSDRPHASTLIGPVDPSWLEPPRRATDSSPPDTGPSLTIEGGPDESGLKETRLRLERERSAALGEQRPNSEWPKVEVGGDRASSPPGSRTIPSDSPGRSAPPSLAPLSSGVAVPGAVVGPYQVLFRLAQGPSSSVFLCREAEHGSVRSLFALKLFRPRPEFDDGLERFNAAAILTEQLTHPNLTRVVGTGTLDGQPLLVSEYVDGCSFAALLKRYATARPIPYVLAVLFDAMRGLSAAHELVDASGAPSALIHGNLCPRDLLLALDGSCKVADLGASLSLRAVGVAELEPGKLGYASPERQRGEPLEPRSDVFSLGAILYDALTGVEPFPAPSDGSARSTVFARAPEPPSTVGLRPPQVFDAVCLRALEPDPERRFQSVRDLLLALEEVALEHDTLASSTEVAGWIAAAFGRELELRRLSILDASRRSRGRGSTSVPPPMVTAEFTSPSLSAPGLLPSGVDADADNALPLPLVPRVPPAALVPRFPEFEPTESTPSRSPVLNVLFALAAITAVAGAVAWLARDVPEPSAPPVDEAGVRAEPRPLPPEPRPGPAPPAPAVGGPGELSPRPGTSSQPGLAAPPVVTGQGLVDTDAGSKRPGPVPRGRRPVAPAPAPAPAPPAPPAAAVEAPTAPAPAEPPPAQAPADSAAPAEPNPAPAAPPETRDSEFRYGI